MAKAKASSKAQVKAKAQPKKKAAAAKQTSSPAAKRGTTAPVAKTGAKKTTKPVAEKKKASSKIETRRPAPAVPAAGGSARPEKRIPAAREKSAAGAPIRLQEPPRSGVRRSRTHLAETPVSMLRKK